MFKGFSQFLLLSLSLVTLFSCSHRHSGGGGGGGGAASAGDAPDDQPIPTTGYQDCVDAIVKKFGMEQTDRVKISDSVTAVSELYLVGDYTALFNYLTSILEIKTDKDKNPLTQPEIKVLFRFPAITSEAVLKSEMCADSIEIETPDASGMPMPLSTSDPILFGGYWTGKFITGFSELAELSYYTDGTGRIKIFIMYKTFLIEINTMVQ